MKLKDFLTLKVGSGILLGSSRYNPNINYTWIVFNDNNTILFNDGNNLGYRE